MPAFFYSSKSSFWLWTTASSRLFPNLSAFYVSCGKTNFLELLFAPAQVAKGQENSAANDYKAVVCDTGTRVTTGCIDKNISLRSYLSSTVLTLSSLLKRT